MGEFFNVAYNFLQASSIISSFPLNGTGMMTAWILATLGGRTKPLSSPCCIIMIPIDRVVNPQLVCQTRFFCFFSSSNSIPNILAKFCPKL